MSEVIGIGTPFFDILCLSEVFPTEDTKERAQKIVFQGGGPCPTAMVAVSKLGHKAAFWGTVGDDAAGNFMLQEFEKYGVLTDEMRVVEGVASCASVVLVSRGTKSRTCIFTKGGLPEGPENLNYDKLEQARLLHLDGNRMEAAIKAAQFARTKGMPVSLDAGNPYPGIDLLLPLVDILIASESFAAKVTRRESSEEAAKELKRRYSPTILVITQGSKGGLISKPDSAEIIRYPAFQVPAVDTNGAGDVFHGAFLTAYLEGMDTEQACIFASAAAALKCTGFGSRASTPTHEAVDNFLTYGPAGMINK